MNFVSHCLERSSYFDLDKHMIGKKEYLSTGAGGTHSNVLLVTDVVSVLVDICAMYLR